ncbi:hypothetical protein ACTFIW_005921 [Dictyostelium discoideum]
MKKNLIPLFIYMLFFYNVVNSGCPICLEENDICGNDKGTCSYGTTCFKNSSLPSNQIRKCTKFLEEGEECGVSNLQDLCVEGTLCLLDKNNVERCLYHSFATLGEDCELDTDCATYQLSCANKECRLKPSKNCDGSDSNCNYDEYCINNSCKKIKFEGESCTYSYECFGKMSCKNNVCFESKLVGLGADCSINRCDYNKELYCSDDICIEYVEPSTKSCNPNATSNLCQSDQICSCSDEECYSIFPTPPEIGKYYYSDDLEKCAFDNKCSLGGVDRFNSKSCVSKNCKKQICSGTVGGINIKEGDDCGKNAFFRDSYCNSSFKLTQSITSLLSMEVFVVDSSCPICLKENDICGTGKGDCSYDTTCFNNTSLPSNQIRKCTKYLREGDECGVGNLQDLCIEGTACLLDKNNVYRCLSHKFATFGEDCELDTDCSTNKLACVNKKCTLKPFENCGRNDENCNYDEYCQVDSCIKLKFEGESCTYSYECFGQMSCKNNVCFVSKLVGLGADCSDKRIMCDYNKGLYCSDDICIEYVEPSRKSCNPNATVNQCTDFQTCSCSDEKCYINSLTPPENDKALYSDDLQKCAFDNKCSPGFNFILISKSCVSKHCKKQICNGLLGGFGTKESDDCGSDVFYRNLYCNSSFKLTQTITSLFIILFFVFVITL